LIQFAGKWDGENLNHVWRNWYTAHHESKLLCLPLLICWSIWLTRNRIIFEDGVARWQIISTKIISAYHELPDFTMPLPRRPLAPNPIDKSIPWAYLDGAAQEHGCGGGFLLYLFDHHHFKVKLGLGEGTNTYVELITLRHLLHFSLGHDCINLQIYETQKSL